MRACLFVRELLLLEKRTSHPSGSSRSGYAAAPGRFENFVFCRGEHLTILTFSMIAEFMREIGYEDIRLYAPVREKNYPELLNDCLQKEYECEFDTPHTLIVEAKKPGRC